MSLLCQIGGGRRFLIEILGQIGRWGISCGTISQTVTGKDLMMLRRCIFPEAYRKVFKRRLEIGYPIESSDLEEFRVVESPPDHSA